MVPPVPTVPPGRFAMAYKNSVRRARRWRAPERYTSVAYKGSGSLDLRAAQLPAPVTTIFAVAYKSDIEITVPPGVRVELRWTGSALPAAGPTTNWSAPPLDVPAVHVGGFAYQGLVTTHTGVPRR